MSLSAAVIRELVNANLSGEELVAAAERFEDAEQSTRSGAAIRQARYRERGGGTIPEELQQAVFDRDGRACLKCDADSNRCCDHIHPVSKGGETTFDNMQTLCMPCDARRGNE